MCVIPFLPPLAGEVSNEVNETEGARPLRFVIACALPNHLSPKRGRKNAAQTKTAAKAATSFTFQCEMIAEEFSVA